MAALDRAAAERREFLASACGGDDALRHDVESLLQAHDLVERDEVDAAAPPAADEPFAPGDVFAIRSRIVAPPAPGRRSIFWRADRFRPRMPNRGAEAAARRPSPGGPALLLMNRGWRGVGRRRYAASCRRSARPRRFLDGARAGRGPRGLRPIASAGCRRRRSRRSGVNCATRWPRRTGRAFFTATSSPRTCSSTNGRCASPISALPSPARDAAQHRHRHAGLHGAGAAAQRRVGLGTNGPLRARAGAVRASRRTTHLQPRGVGASPAAAVDHRRWGRIRGSNAW